MVQSRRFPKSKRSKFFGVNAPITPSKTSIIMWITRTKCFGREESPHPRLDHHHAESLQLHHRNRPIAPREGWWFTSSFTVHTCHNWGVISRTISTALVQPRSTLKSRALTEELPTVAERTFTTENISNTMKKNMLKILNRMGKAVSTPVKRVRNTRVA